jgi:predicted permease
VLQDLRFAVRQLRKQWPLTLGAALSLGLGIGGTATMFALVRAVLTDPLPATDTRGVYFVYRTFAQTGTVAGGLFTTGGLMPVSYPDYEDFRDQAKSFEALAAEAFGAFNLSTGQGPEVVSGAFVTANYFDALRLMPRAGRFFLPEEDRTRGSHPVVVLSHALWTRRFGADPGVVGREIPLNGRVFTVVGVAPPGFQGTTPLAAPQLFVPTAMAAALANDPGIFGQLLDHRGVRLFNVFGRLREGVGPGPAAAEMRTIAERLAEAHPQWDRNRSTHLVPLAQAAIVPALRGPVESGSGLLLGAVLLLLVIACANVANLLLARGLAREGEMATRLALGAPAQRIVRQLLVESLLLWSLGGAFGVLLAVWARQAVPSLLPPFLPQGAIEATVDLKVLLFATVLTLMTGLLFGLAPALRAARTDLMTVLRSRGGAGGRLGARRVLVGAQVAFASVALVAAGAFLASLRNARRIDPGYDTRGLALVSLDLAARGFEPARGQAFQRELLDRVAARPEVRQVALASQAPLSFAGSRRIVIPGAEEITGPDGTYITTNSVSPGFFALLGLEARRGRLLEEGDDERGRPVAVINETMARRFWPGQEAVGRQIRWPARPSPLEVVGVVPDIKYATLGEEPAPYIYLPLAQDYSTGVTLHVRASGPPSLPALVAEIQRLDPDLAVLNPRSMEQAVDQALWGARTAASLLSGFGLLALLLAATGVYAVMSQLLAQRRHEIGLRLALGATPGRILSFSLAQGVRLVVVGLALGSILGLAMLRLFAGLLYGWAPAQASLSLAGPALLGAAALLACLLPARAAARMDPLATLRE